MTEARFVDLETKIAHQDLLLEELNKVIYEQQKSIDLLEKRLTQLTKKLQEALEGDGGVDPSHQKPPHY